jgi:hypothetical protein
MLRAASREQLFEHVGDGHGADGPALVVAPAVSTTEQPSSLAASLSHCATNERLGRRLVASRNCCK